jgi:hypothetical protein
MNDENQHYGIVLLDISLAYKVGDMDDPLTSDDLGHCEICCHQMHFGATLSLMAPCFGPNQKIWSQGNAVNHLWHNSLGPNFFIWAAKKGH